jgi:hypothetical protein
MTRPPGPLPLPASADAAMPQFVGQAARARRDGDRRARGGCGSGLRGGLLRGGNGGGGRLGSGSGWCIAGRNIGGLALGADDGDGRVDVDHGVRPLDDPKDSAVGRRLDLEVSLVGHHFK